MKSEDLKAAVVCVSNYCNLSTNYIIRPTCEKIERNVNAYHSAFILLLLLYLFLFE